ncbi:hypothetical protein AYI69_g10263, partial [Smittium culicis]
AEFKAVDKDIEPPAAELIESGTKESDNITPPVRRRGTVELKRPPSCSKTVTHTEQPKKIAPNNNSPRSSDSDGYIPPTVLDRMAEKSQNGEITEEQYIILQEEYVLKNFTKSEVEMDSGIDDGDRLGSSERPSQMDTDTDL